MAVLSAPASLDDAGVITWSEEAGGSAQWDHGFFRTTRGMTIDRVVSAPHTGSTLRLPVLPTDFADLNPQSGDGDATMFFFVGS